MDRWDIVVVAAVVHIAAIVSTAATVAIVAIVSILVDGLHRILVTWAVLVEVVVVVAVVLMDRWGIVVGIVVGVGGAVDVGVGCIAVAARAAAGERVLVWHRGCPVEQRCDSRPDPDWVRDGGTGEEAPRDNRLLPVSVCVVVIVVGVVMGCLWVRGV